MSTAFFEKLLAEHGDSPRSLDWSPEGQADRFRVLCEVSRDTRGRGQEIQAFGKVSVLDVGCGLGHFLNYLRSVIGHDGDYRGLDVSKKMVEAAQRRNALLYGAETAALFRTHDAVAHPIPAEYHADYVVASGVLNLEVNGGAGGDHNAMENLLRHCYDACRVACAVNMLSSRAPEKREGRVYRDPEWAIEAALRIAPRATLRHDYRPNDFTLYLYRDPR